MPYIKYAQDINTYHLKQGVTLQRAKNRDFIKSWVVYRNINEDFSQSFAETKKELEGVPFCFWIEENHKRLGGVVMLPNGIGDFFLIPPEEDAHKILSLVIPLLIHWSDGQKSIDAQAITTQYLAAFQSFGFVLQESRLWMIRPTAALEEPETSAWLFSPLIADKTEDIAALFTAAFTGGVGQYGTRDYDSHLASVRQFFDKFDAETACGQASALVVEKKSGQLAGVCLVERHKNLPTIRFVAVKPQFQRRGLATKLITRAISILAPKYDWLKLAVTVGNPAVDVYKNLNFIPGNTLHELSIPAKN